MHFIDSHAHLSSPSVLGNIENILKRAKEKRVVSILNICTDPISLQKGLELESQCPFIKNAGATTPHDVLKEGELAFAVFELAALEKKLVAIGETGLDYHYEHSPKEIQKKYLKKYIQLAIQTSLPLIFHCREAFQDLFSITDVEYPKTLPAVLHCFTGTLEEAEKVLERGWYLSLSGIVTFKKSEWLREIARIVPLSQLLIETDTPFLAPQSQRGKANEPGFLPEVAEVIAVAKNIPVNEVAIATAENARRLFQFSS